ncbi:hypothetical protein [Dickeya dianthicola]|uniref:Uncharacterized protein n=1 Tax=Dickeya dianthicola TaxID=204039 RepID=A0AAP2D324_9GAMM|nr:hypothetical protein [Dickeya dianthicola]MBT1429690.1 hypothetical protein [Dickeya dianthicola]MBT1429691.1 hypothetical protein [Dickeya dianthicola]MBT1461207.1 hypothetical protein [Dickeya dianthicola]MBT1461208.1 hypothetical protein [Dickeya dianthicola]MBT1490401.1 hypothetical protein [Dickeya dianthicola]
MALKPIRTGIIPMRSLLSGTFLLCGTLLLSGCPRTSAWPDSGAGTPPANQPAPYGQCDKVGSYDIRFDRFDETAQQIAHATGCGIITDNSTAAVRPHPVVGTMTIRQAVQMAITGTRLRITHQDAESITVE